MYGKIFTSIFDSSLVADGGWLPTYIFMSMVAMADKDGICSVAPRVLYTRLGMDTGDDLVSYEKFIAAIEYLERPDLESRLPDMGGKRIVPMREIEDLEGNRGWLIVNYEHYKQLGKKLDKSEGVSERVRRFRNGDKVLRSGYVYFVAATVDEPIKIGFSANPWARLNELQTGNSSTLKLLATLKADLASEKEIHDIFAEYREQNEWFQPVTPIKQLIAEVADGFIADYEQLLKRAVELRSNYAGHIDIDTDIDTKKKDLVGLAPDQAPVNGKNGTKIRVADIEHIEQAIALLNEKTGKSFRVRHPDGTLTHGADLVRRILKKGYTLQDVRIVIARQCREWGADDKMARCLTPETLFRLSNFTKYRGASEAQ